MPPKPEYIHDLKRDVALLSERIDNLRVETTDLARQDDTNQAEAVALKESIADVRKELALIQQRLDEHIKRVETWDARRWGLLMLMAGALMSLASGLIVTLARK